MIESSSKKNNISMLHIISAPAAGGAEVYVKDLSIEFATRGFDIHIGFVSHATDNGRSNEYEMNYLSELKSYGISYFFIGHECRNNPLKGSIKIFNYCRLNKIDIYHSHLKYGIIFGALLRIPRIYTHHNISPEVRLFTYKILNIFVDRYVGISNICSRALRNFTGQNIFTIFNGVNTDKITPYIRRHDNYHEKIECIAIGRIQDQKNYQLLIEALKLLPPDVLKKFHVSIAGEGPQKNTQELKSKISESGLDNIVTLLGNRSDIPELLGKSHLFLMTSAWEGLPISLIEATISGLPFISTDVGGCSEVADACKNGIIVPPNDAYRFAKNLREISENNDILKNLSANAINHRFVFNIKGSADKHLNLYRMLLNY